MPVYLRDGLVLLDSGSVATSENCCCGGVFCCGFSGFAGDGGCGALGYTQINCDGTYSNCADPHTHYFSAICSPCPGEPGIPETTTVDRDTGLTNDDCSTCLEVNNCVCPDCFNDPFPCGNSFSVVLGDPVVCLGACCLFGGCIEDLSEGDCVGFGGIYQGDGTDCDPDPC